MSRTGTIQEIRRTFAIKKQGLYSRKERDLRELEEARRANHKALEDAHKEEVKGVRGWFLEEMAIAKQEEEAAISNIPR